MKTILRYEDVPEYYTLCLEEQCLHKADCLRSKVAALVPKEVPRLLIVNPMYIIDKEKCPFFQADTTTRFAIGISHLYDKLPRSVYPSIKKKIYNYFGHNGYYRIYHKSTLISPKDQAFIRQVFIKEGIEDEPLFDEYVDRYDFFPDKE